MINWVEKVNKVTSPSDEWNGVIITNVVELRKKFSQDGHFSQVLIRIREDGRVEVSMNGKASMKVEDIVEMSEAVIEGQTKLALR